MPRDVTLRKILHPNNVLHEKKILLIRGRNFIKFDYDNILKNSAIAFSHRNGFRVNSERPFPCEFEIKIL